MHGPPSLIMSFQMHGLQLFYSLMYILKHTRDIYRCSLHKGASQNIMVFQIIDIALISLLVRLPNEDFGCNPKTNSPHKMFLHKCVLQYVRTLKLNDATLASLGKLKYSRWRPRWLPKDKILNIF